MRGYLELLASGNLAVGNVRALTTHFLKGCLPVFTALLDNSLSTKDMGLARSLEVLALLSGEVDVTGQLLKDTELYERLTFTETVQSFINERLLSWLALD